MRQGYPDPYSSFSQGLTQGVQTGGNIMQLMRQKAEAAQASANRDLALDFEIFKDKNVPNSFKDEIYKARTMKALNLQYGKDGVNIPTSFEWGGKISEEIAALMKTYKKDPELLHRLVKETIMSSPDAADNMSKYKPLLDDLEPPAKKAGRKMEWEGT